MKITINGYLIEGTVKEVYELLGMYKLQKSEWDCGVGSINSTITGSTFEGTILDVNSAYPKITGIKMTEFNTRNNEKANEPTIDFE